MTETRTRTKTKTKTETETGATIQASITSVSTSLSQADYFDRIHKIKEWIAQGEVYQINSTFALNVSTQGSAQALYRKLANQHPSAHAAYIEDDEQTVLSFSPELFLQRRDTTLITRPMKGTAPRSSDPVEDQRLGQRLQASEKDRAENLMIVDLLRNDLGRIATPGSVRAEPLFSLEAYPSVWTMTSTIQASITAEITLEQILRALFPCGSITGAPKIAAMKRIQQTEAQPRGLYCGSVGWLAPDGDFSLNVAIRTLLLKSDGSGLYHVGGGIVHDSVAEQEWEECHWKARIVIDRPEPTQPRPHSNL
jgi:para-aminobenzoate synthetase component 1